MNRLRSRPLPVSLRDALAADLDSRPDGELLDRFARYADHPAFEVLVRRHGPMVFGVCRRVLGRSADADDAFQATFLVLIRKAKSVRRGDRLAPYLYGIATRVALKARAQAARRAASPIEGADMLPDPHQPAEIPDWLPILDAELNALPAKFRDALVLCELRGAARADAAKQLGVPEGTLSSRLARGRDLLRKRLLKHGTLLPAGGLAALFAVDGVSRATAPAALLAAACELPRLATAGAVPAGAARLADEVLRSMFLTKLKYAACALALCVAAVGASAALPSDAPDDGPKAKSGAAVAPPKVAPPAPAKSPDRAAAPKGAAPADRDALQGLWLLEKVVTSKGQPAGAGGLQEMVGAARFLIAGDTWWLMDGIRGEVMPYRAALNPVKNPKWLDWHRGPDAPQAGAKPEQRLIYELTGDTLRVCMSAGEGEARPAEFAVDTDEHLITLSFRRDKLPPPAGDKELVGRWAGEMVNVAPPGKPPLMHFSRAEVFDGFIFVQFEAPQSPDRRREWLGGRYTIDATKNPKWIDVDTGVPEGKAADGKAVRLYGSYEVVSGRLKMALGTKRATRPLEFKDAKLAALDLLPLKDDPGLSMVVPVPTSPDERDAPPMRNIEFGPAPRDPNAPLPDAGIRTDFERMLDTGDFAGAEKYLGRAVGWSAAKRVEARTQLGHAILHKAGDSTPRTMTKLYDDAATAFRAAAADAAKLPAADTAAAKLRWEAELGLLVALQHGQKPDDLLSAATAMLGRHRGDVEELVLLVMTAHAHDQRKEFDKATAARERVKALYAKLPDSAFPEKVGHHSRQFWESQGYGRK